MNSPAPRARSIEPEIAAWGCGARLGPARDAAVVMGLEDIFFKLTQSEPEEEEASDA